MRSGGEAWKNGLRGSEKAYGLFLNSASPTIAAQLSTAGYDWLLVDTQHGPMNPETLYVQRRTALLQNPLFFTEIRNEIVLWTFL